MSFDSVGHSLLLEKVAKRIQDGEVMHLLKMILKASGKKGVPQGGVMTPRTQKITSHLSGGCGSGGNRVRILLRQVDQLSDAAERLAQDCSISPRQAYRYLEHAQQLKGPVPPGEAKLAFTVKLPNSLIQRVRAYATTKRLSISEVVSRALLALLPRGRGRG